MPFTDTKVRLAAQYLRMSTDLQQYSLANQSSAIEQYATEHNMRIVRTYSDSAKTGLTFANRLGLKQLIHDVESGSAEFNAVLVYDVSRWGRFQDVDESAYYEYRCRLANIAVHYCAESFANDGSVTASLLKALKRAMAAEYSRELSAKVFAGKVRLVELGFRQGGPAGYGLRRLLLDQHGTPKVILKDGECKSITTDRVILVPGPPREREVVSEIFALYASKKHSPADIAALLNARGEPWRGGRPWTRHVIRDMVTNPKYVGCNISNRRSGKLRSRRVWNPPELWVQREHAFEAIIAADLYQRAVAVAKARIRNHSNAELLQSLRDFKARHGRVTSRQIAADLDMPCPQLYASRFGSLAEAYRLIGNDVGQIKSADRFRRFTSVRRGFTADIVERLRAQDLFVKQDSRTKLLHLRRGLRLKASVLPCNLGNSDHGWLIRPGAPVQSGDLVIVGCLGPDNSTFSCIFCFPREALGIKKQVRVRHGRPSLLDPYRFSDLSFLETLGEGAPVYDAEAEFI